MYTKEELESMDVPQLMGIASELGLKVKQDDDRESVVYAILDKAAEESASPKRKRTRILKKDTSRVYSVNGEEGENFDSKANRKKKKAEAPSLFADLPQRNVAVRRRQRKRQRQQQRPKDSRQRLKQRRWLRCQKLLRSRSSPRPTSFPRLSLPQVPATKATRKSRRIFSSSYRRKWLSVPVRMRKPM